MIEGANAMSWLEIGLFGLCLVVVLGFVLSQLLRDEGGPHEQPGLFLMAAVATLIYLGLKACGQ